MAIFKDLIKADASLSGKRIKSAIDSPRIAMGAYAYLRDGEGNIKALDKAEREILNSGDEALIAEWESLVEELNKASSEFIKTYMEAKDSPLQKLAKLR